MGKNAAFTPTHSQGKRKHTHIHKSRAEKMFSCYSCRHTQSRAGEMPQWFKVLVTLIEKLGLILSTYIVAYNHL